MKVYIEGHNCKNPLQEIIHAFTADSDICFCHPSEPKEGNWVSSKLEDKAGSLLITTEICHNGKVYHDRYESSNLVSNAVKSAYYLLACKVYGYALPWGSHTGIRPARIAGDYITKGKDPITELAKNYFITPQKAQLATHCAHKGLALAKKASNNGVSLYISIPYCPSRCLYCSFISTPIKSFEKQIIPYLNLLIKEIEHTGELINSLGLTIDTVYIGGGTPTILDADSLKQLISAIYTNFNLGGIAEFTVEAGRPDTITRDKLSVLKSLSVTRISINPQTLNDSVLEKIGRRHTSYDFSSAFEMARECGFDNINTDLIAGLPSESEEMFLSSLNKLLEYRPESVTVHTMCVKRASRLKSEQEIHTPMHDGVATRMVEASNRILSQCGYSPYYLYRQKDTLDNLENTGYSLPNKECLYNVLMMDDVQSIIAMGAGGVTKLVVKDKIERIFNMKNPVDYISRFDEVLSRKNAMTELLKEINK